MSSKMRDRVVITVYVLSDQLDMTLVSLNDFSLVNAFVP